LKGPAQCGRDLGIKAGYPDLKDRANNPPRTGTTALRNGKGKTRVESSSRDTGLNETKTPMALPTTLRTLLTAVGIAVAAIGG
jgi:hypothetical protein